ncbi:MAG: hypothetical protein AB8H47_14040 [Bacteroidia bacterium]
MPKQTEVRVWKVCWKWGFIPYPCRKIETRWCYEFSKLTETGYGFICKLVGCESNIQYKWWAFCFNIWGSTTYFNITKCFKTERPIIGHCEEVIID